jgi:hypothetical protein
LGREEKRKKWISMFFTYGEEEEEEMSFVCCEIGDFRFFIGRFTNGFTDG